MFLRFSKKFLSTMTDPLKCKWEEVTKTTEVLIMTCSGYEPRAAIAAFDMDGTIITTKSGRVFPTHINDWKLQYDDRVAQTIQKYHGDGFKVVIFTNQNGIASGKMSKSDFKQKIQAIVQRLNVPLQLY